MKGFVIGFVGACVAVALGIYLVSRFGLYPIGADNPPSDLERRLASRALNVYANRHKPDGDHVHRCLAAGVQRID